MKRIRAVDSETNLELIVGQLEAILEDYGLAQLIEENDDEILGFSDAKAFYGGSEASST